MALTAEITIEMTVSFEKKNTTLGALWIKPKLRLQYDVRLITVMIVMMILITFMRNWKSVLFHCANSICMMLCAHSRQRIVSKIKKQPFVCYCLFCWGSMLQEIFSLGENPSEQNSLGKILRCNFFWEKTLMEWVFCRGNLHKKESSVW